jgi:hypothetical protein
MKLSEFKKALNTLNSITFILPDGSFVPNHFHVTEVGELDKKFIDCGGSVRFEKKVNFQLWSSHDTDHRLAAEKLLKIIELSEKTLSIGDYEIEVEYQNQTIGKYGVEFDGSSFLLTNQQTDCLAQDKCGIPAQKPRIKLSDLNNSSCTPGGGCC